MRSQALLAFACSIATPAALLACAPALPPAAPDTSASPPSSASPTSVAPPPQEAAPPAVEQRPLDLTNECTREMHVYYGEQPGDGKGQAATVASGAVVSVPRNPDGTAVVWVTDDKGGALASVHVTRRMRHVRIAPSCMGIEAGSTR